VVISIVQYGPQVKLCGLFRKGVKY